MKSNDEIFIFIEIIITELKSYVNEKTVVDDNYENHRQELSAALLVARICEISKASLLIMRSGLSNEAHSMLRIFLDAYFVFGAICTDKDYVKEYFSTDFAARLKLINVAEKYSSDLFSLIREMQPKIKSDLENCIKSESIQEFKSFNFATKCGSTEIFDSIYRVCSASLHSTPRSLVPYMKTEGDSLIGIEFSPVADDINEVAITLAEFLIKVYSGITEIFGSYSKEIIHEKYARLSAISGEI